MGRLWGVRISGRAGSSSPRTSLGSRWRAPPKPLSDYLASPQVPLIPSEDGKGAMVVLSLDQKGVSQTRRRWQACAGAADRGRQGGRDLAPRGISAHVTGPAGFIADIVKAFAGIDGLLWASPSASCCSFSSLSTAAPSYPLRCSCQPFRPVPGRSHRLPTGRGRAHRPVGPEPGIMFILVVGAATDYALLLVARYKEEPQLRISLGGDEGRLACVR